MPLLLAGDVGGTSTRLGLFTPASGRPRPETIRSFTTLDYDGLEAIAKAFVAESAGGARIDAACFGVAGPVRGRTATLSNVPWTVDADRLAGTLGAGRVDIVNDLVAQAFAIDVLEASELAVLQAGRPEPDGNRALVAAGTGLGEALLHRIDGGFVPSPSEAGHADFAARTDRELALVRDLRARFGRAMVEHVVSGHGLVNLHRFTHEHPKTPCAASIDRDSADAPAEISQAAMTGRCPACRDALTLFLGAYGAEAGNAALRGLATGGVYLGGGIAPKLLPALRDGTFLEAFLAKQPFDGLMAAVPVHVILNDDAGLVGAAVGASRHVVMG